MKLIALSGGIASGKSTVARRLVEHGAFHIDADQLAREAVAPQSRGLEQVRRRFGDKVIAHDGSLNRAALGEIVFTDVEALNDLNGIIHPEVRRIADERMQQIATEQPEAVVIYDVPLLVEANVQMPWDSVVITEAPAEVRKHRMMTLRGMSAEEADQRLANQATDEQRRAIADVIIDTSGTLQETVDQADRLWEQLTADQAE